MRNDDVERRKELESMLQADEVPDCVMLESVIRMAYHYDGTPRDFQQLELREMLRLHPNFSLILKEGVGDGND